MRYGWRRADMFEKLVPFIKSMLMFGTSFGLTYWDYRECEKKRMKPVVLNGVNVWNPAEAEKIMVTEYDGPNFEPLNIYDCFPDPNSTSLRDMRWFIYRTFKTLDELKQKNYTRGTDYYQNLDELERRIGEKKEKKNVGNPTDMQFREHRRIMLSTQELHGEDESNPEIVVLRRFDKKRWVDIVPEFDLG